MINGKTPFENAGERNKELIRKNIEKGVINF